jgi:hypothetical protein
MSLQHRSEDNEEFFVSKKFVKSVIIGAILGGVVALLAKLLRSRTRPIHPPIIIRSIEEPGPNVPIEIETKGPFEESQSSSGLGAIAGLESKLYRMKGFGPVIYVGIFGERRIGDDLEVEYENATDGLEVRIWLQKYEFKQWAWEVDGPHFLIDANSPNFQLTCAELDFNGSNLGNIDRPSKHLFSTRRTWRIGKIQVNGGKKIETHDCVSLEVLIDNQLS